MKAYRINPLTRTIEEVQFDGTFQGMDKLFPYNIHCIDGSKLNDACDFIVHINPQLTNFLLATAPDILAKQYGVFGYICGGCSKLHSVYGTALIFGRNESKESDRPDDIQWQDPKISIEQLREYIHWGDMQKVSLEEAETLREGHMPDRLRTQEVYDAKSAVIVGMELGRIGSKVH